MELPTEPYIVCTTLQEVFAIVLLRCLWQTGLAEFVGILQLQRKEPSTMAGLVTTGCYERVRHPVYSLAILFMVLRPMITERWLTFTVRCYRGRVPMFIPHFPCRRGNLH